MPFRGTGADDAAMAARKRLAVVCGTVAWRPVRPGFQFGLALRRPLRF
jgi:hypothetical protein